MEYASDYLRTFTSILTSLFHGIPPGPTGTLAGLFQLPDLDSARTVLCRWRLELSPRVVFEEEGIAYGWSKIDRDCQEEDQESEYTVPKATSANVERG